MSNLRFEYSSAPLRTVQEIQFGLLSPEEIKNMSVVHIEYPETMDEQRQRPREKGLNDPKLGVIDRGVMCATCGETQAMCPGHFGHIELAVPVFHIGFLTKVKKLLETVCHNCGKILADESDPQFIDALRRRNPKSRFDHIHRLCKAKDECVADPPDDEMDHDGTTIKEMAKKIRHGGCGHRQPEIRKEGIRLVGTIKTKKSDDDEMRQPEKKPISPAECLKIFKAISAEDVRKLGLSNDYARPEWMIITVLPVPPPQVRPSIVVGGVGSGMRGEDDLTYKLGDIIRANGNVRRCYDEGSPQHVISEFESLLQFHVATFMDNNIAGQPQALQKSGRPVKSIRARLKGKEGRLRGNLMGKRVDFSARTVITGDPNLSLDEVGVPKSIARTLTYPETVTFHNIERLSQLVRNGPNEHPGARFVFRDDGQMYDLKQTSRLNTPVNLQLGWKVERHIVDGDFIIFNRQPSLHKESMMGHRVKVMPYSTFRLNLSVTSPYNADFDGDEMNLHVPQSEETRAEVMNLCMVPLNIVSPQKNSPLMGIVQDTLCGIYKMCRRDVFISYDQVMNLLLWVPDWDGIIPPPVIFKPRPKWTGKQIISLILPEGLNLSRTTGEGWSPLTDDGCHIDNGELMFGLFTKKIVGASAAGIIHLVFNEKGPEAAVKFFNGAQRVVCYWLLHNGFSIGIGDTIPDAATVALIEDAVNKRKAAVEMITRDATTAEFEALPGMNIRESFEAKVSKELNSARDDAGTGTAKSLKDINNAIQMARSGSKGSEINISQMTAVVGQQSVEGKRIPFGFKYRTLPHFTKDDYSPEARGFVENSYLRGLTPTEFFFHAMGGREGLIDTAVKTAETGYIQRRLVKALEDVMAKYDGTVRNSLGDVVQFVYGEDGLDAVHIESQKLGIIACSDDKFDKMFRLNIIDEQDALKDYVVQANDLAGDVEVQRLFDEEYEAIMQDRKFLRDGKTDDDESMQLPLNIARTITTTQTLFKLKKGVKSDLDPSYAIPAVRELLDKLVIVRGNDAISQEAQENATILFKAQVRSTLAYKRVVTEHYLTKLAFDHVVGYIESRFSRALVSPGEMVGVLAAQSIGEPATQMTLNTFHFAGVAAKNVTLGVPRLKEILNVATDIKTPSMNVYQIEANRRSGDAAKQLRSQVEHTTMASVTHATEIYYDPDVQTTIITADRDMVESYFIIPEDTEGDPNDQSKFFLRIVFNRKKLLDKNLTAKDIAAAIKRDWKSTDIAIIFSDDNADEQVIRVRLGKAFKEDDEDDDFDDPRGAGRGEENALRRIEGQLLDLTLRGVRGVDRVFLTQEAALRIDESGKMIKSRDDPLCQEWKLETSGVALGAVLNVPGVDPYRTYSNSFVEILQVFGIEATRSALMRELKAVLSFDGSYVNHRHLALLVDVMTSRGHLMAVTRHGINRADTGALMRCSFEETVEILLDAAASGELDDCRGVSENVMLGQLAPLGTGELEVFLDQDMLDTIASDNAARVGMSAGFAAGGMENGAQTPYAMASPMADNGFASPDYGAQFSPIAQHADDNAGGFTSYGDTYGSGGMSPFGAASPGGSFAPASPFSGTSPTSPGGFSPASPRYSPASPSLGLASPAFNPTSPGFSPASPAFGTPTSPAYSPASPAFGQGVSPTSPSYSPTSPNYSPTSPSYSPTSPSYSPTSPAAMASSSNQYSPASPAYSPTSPKYSPTSPANAPRTNQQSPTSPKYSPTSPAAYSPTSPKFGSPTSPNNAASPQWTPTSPTSPTYSPTSPRQ